MEILSMSAYKHKIPQAEDNRSGGEESYLFCTNVNRKKRETSCHSSHCFSVANLGPLSFTNQF